MAGIERFPRVLAASAGLLLSVGCLACGGSPKPKANTIGLARSLQQGQTAAVDYPDEYTRRIIIHSPTRDANGTQEVDDYCDEGRYYRHDPASPHYGKGPDEQLRGKAAQEACADGVLTPGDPFPISPLPN